MNARDGSMEGLPCRFGKYTLIRKLASGGMAELFLALQKSVAGFEKLVVIKRILPAMNQDRAFIDMLLHEARVAATLSHPNVVQVFDVGEVDGTYFIAMEHVHGEDLRSIVRQMKKKEETEFPLEHALAILLGMCAGLAYAHEKRDLDGTPLHIVHRDVSPQNVLVTFTGDVKIVDFGIAKSDAARPGQSESGRLKGKIPYMSPEQARGERVDWRTDVFAAGTMLFELTTGKRLFKGASEFESLKLICEREYPTPSQVRDGYPPELEAVVMRALEKKREDRWQSAREMQAAIEQFVRAERVPVSNIALSQFMQRLFAEKLAAQKEALLQGKQLADVLAHQGAGESASGHGGSSQSQSISVAAASARTVADVAAAKKGLMWGAGAAGIGVAAIVGTLWMARHGDAHETAMAATLASTAAAVPSVTATASVAEPEASASTSSAPADPDAPAASVAAHKAPRPQPGAHPTQAPAAAPVGTGKLNVSAHGGWCNVSVDGTPRGPTPVAGIVLSAGSHTVTCTPEGGRTLSTGVRIDADGTTRYAFTLPP
ncbi:MAG TPA: serine/threonine-protein kinase [Polyangiaceae bacterium]|nr:serine/threonine-protein kinase [Polyangiaceae bacterium]